MYISLSALASNTICHAVPSHSIISLEFATKSVPFAFFQASAPSVFVVLPMLPNNNSLKELRNVRSELKCNFYLKKLPDHFLILDSINNIQSLFSENYHHEEIYHNPVQALKKIKKIGANYSNNLTTNINKSMLLKLLQYNNSDNKNFILSWDISYFLCIK